MPRRPSSIAQAIPVGPAPTIATGKDSATGTFCPVAESKVQSPKSKVAGPIPHPPGHRLSFAGRQDRFGETQAVSRGDRFEDLEAWKAARALTCAIYRITSGDGF